MSFSYWSKVPLSRNRSVNSAQKRIFSGRWNNQLSGRGVVSGKQAGNDAVSVARRNPDPPATGETGRGFYTGKGTFFVLGAPSEYPREYDAVDAETRQAIEAGVPLDDSARGRVVSGNTRRLVDTNSISGRMTAFFKGKRYGPKLLAPDAYVAKQDELIRRQFSSRSVNILANRTRNGK